MNTMQNYDERQKFLRYKYGYEAFFLLLALTAINSFICTVIYEWAEQNVSAFAVIFISAFYFGLRTVLSGAYAGNEEAEKRTARILPLTVVIVLLMCAAMLPDIIRGVDPLIVDGKVTSAVYPVIVPPFVIPIVVAFFVKRSRDRKRDTP